MEETIAAIATPPGEGGVGVIRISGRDALTACKTVCSTDLDEPEPRKARLVELSPAGDAGISDRALLTYFPEPNSYTAEDVVELSCHGSPLLLQKILQSILELETVRLAEPGEFTRRAFSNGKLDLAQASAVGDLISARSEAALRASSRQLKGELSEKIGELRKSLVEARSQVEARLDFNDEADVGELDTDSLRSSLETTENRLDNLISQGEIGKLIKSGCQVAIVGPPNVGKSSLFNLLLEKDRAIVTTRPGTTRDVLKEEVALEGIPITLHDTAGIHGSPGAVEAHGVERSETAIEEADLALFLLDADRPPGPRAERVDELLSEADTATILVVNKIDLTDDVDEAAVRARIDREVDCRLSVKERTGLAELEQTVVEKITGGRVNFADPLVTRTRHLRQLKNTRSHLEAAAKKLAGEPDLTLVAEDLRLAGRELGKITGRITTDEVLDEIFAGFCIGK